MSRILIETFPTRSASGLFRALADHAGLLATGLRSRTADARARQAIGQLDGEQLRDIGVDPSTFRRPRPTFEAQAGLIANLTAMR